ncbi:hypothetical protein SAMN05192588_0257 [Nonlabens sp. Hel1_33_55]|uniref:hypothetical protein n=1 Tax=Nonlabens sp. Hel1_33_55 TaxID=1336802 RepID=UPI000875DF06|nr:hypothetical protein [Nonlabens sp. Hel1_33_55]SCX91820.1 hypothetical protein SAMN05192588_0257 [Nonlabens sp. Hel1_33_55]
MTQDDKPPIFSNKSLRTLTKGVAIYAGFYVAVVVGQTISQPVSENSAAPQNAYMPLYFLAAAHLLLGLINLGIILSKRYNWFVPSISGILMILSRIYHTELEIWVWSWS